MVITMKKNSVTPLFFLGIYLIFFGLNLRNNSLFFMLNIFFASLIHEITHLIFIRIFGRSLNFSLSPAGIDIGCLNKSFLPNSVLFIAFAGPLSNFLIFLLLSLLNLFFSSPNISVIAQINLITAMINLFPIKPLDGYTIGQTLLQKKYSLKSVRKISSVFTCIFLIIMWIISLYLMLYFNNNFSLFAMCIYLFYSNYLSSSNQEKN